MKKINLPNRLISLFAFSIILTSFSTSVLASTYEYDANGNMVRDSEKAQCYVYNQANQLKEVNNCAGVKIAQYGYDYTGRRVITVEYNSTGGNVTTYSLFPEFEVVVGGPNQGNYTYIYANGERVARIDPDGSKHYYSGDHLGSTSIVTDENGSIEEKTRYLPYGETLFHTGKNTTKHQYTGQEKDTETGLYYYLSRYYNPQLPRFIQPDTYVANIYNPQDLNPYSYVQNNPLKYTDPTGHVLEEKDMATQEEVNTMFNLIKEYYKDVELSDKDLMRIAIKLYAPGAKVSDGEINSGDYTDLKGYILKEMGREALPRGVSTKEFGDVDLAHAFMGYLVDEQTGISGSSIIAGYGNEVMQYLDGSYRSVFSPEDQLSMAFGSKMCSTEGGNSIEKFNKAYEAAGPKEASQGYTGKLNSDKIPETINPLPIKDFELPNPLYYGIRYETIVMLII